MANKQFHVGDRVYRLYQFNEPHGTVVQETIDERLRDYLLEKVEPAREVEVEVLNNACHSCVVRWDDDTFDQLGDAWLRESPVV